MVLPIWNEPKRIIPSPAYLGEADKDIIHLAVGRALNEWENLEQILSWIFGHLVESRSIAASRAYGTLVAGVARHDALEAATWEFFRQRGDPMMLDYVDSQHTRMQPNIVTASLTEFATPQFRLAVVARFTPVGSYIRRSTIRGGDPAPLMPGQSTFTRPQTSTIADCDLSNYRSRP